MGEQFMNSALSIWMSSTFQSLEPPTNIYRLADGEFLNKIITTVIPSRFTMSRVNTDVGEDTKERIENLNILVKNLIFYYEEVLQCLFISKIPDIRSIGAQPQSYITAIELEKIVTLILGIAFQCDNKHTYIEEVQHFPEDIQQEIMKKLQEVTETNELVVSSYVDPESLEKQDVDGLCKVLLNSLQNVVLERNEIHEKYIRVAAERDEYQASQTPTRSGRKSAISRNDSMMSSDNSRPNTPAYNSEIADLRAKLLKYEDEIESKSDVITKLMEESQASAEHITRLKTEYRTLYDDAQAARIYRDEIDALRTKAEKLDKYEADIAKYRDKLEDMEYLKNRVKELKNHNDQLVEMNELLKDELVNSEQTRRTMIAEEEKNLKLRAMLKELSAQKDYGDRVIQDLTNKKKQIELELTHSSKMISQMQKEIDELTASNNEIRMALLEKDGESMKYMNIEKELSHDSNNGETPIINRKRSTAVWESKQDDANSDALNSKIKRLEMDNLHFKTQTEQLKNHNAKLQLLEHNSEKDKLVIDTNKAEITKLQEEVSLERSKVDNFDQKLEKAYKILQDIGYDTDKLNEVDVISDRDKFLKYEERLKQSLNHSIKMKEERISVLEERVKENTCQNDSLRQELSIIKKQNKSVQKLNQSLQLSLDTSVRSCKSPSRSMSKGVQYEVSMTTSLDHGDHVILSTPKKRPSATSFSPVKNVSPIKMTFTDENKSPNKTKSSEILNVSYESVSLTESEVGIQMLKQDVIELKEENDRLFQEKDRLDQEIEQLQVQRRSHLSEIQDLREQTIEMKNETHELDRECKRQGCKLEEFEIACTALEDMNEKLKRACEELETEKTYINAQCNKLLIQNQELLIKTIEDQEKNREETRVFQDQILSMKQDNQHLAMNLALKHHTTDTKKKPFYKSLFKSSKKKKEDMGTRSATSGTPNIDEYLEQLSLDSTERLTPPDSHVFEYQHHLDSDNSSRTMSGDGRLEYKGSKSSINSLNKDVAHGFRSLGLSRTMSADHESRDSTPKRAVMRLSHKSESFDLTPRVVEPRSMSRPIPPGTHGTPDHLHHRAPYPHDHQQRGPHPHDHQQRGPHPHDHQQRAPHPHDHQQRGQHEQDHQQRGQHEQDQPLLSSHSVQSLSNYTTVNRAHEVLTEPPSAFRQYNSNTSHHSLGGTVPPTLPPRHHRSIEDPPHHRAAEYEHSRSRSVTSSISGSYRGLHDEDPNNSSYYEYGCV